MPHSGQKAMNMKDGGLVPISGKETVMQEQTGGAPAATQEPMKLDVSVRLIDPVKNLIGFASVKFNDCFVVENFKILQGEKGIYAGMPSQPDRNGGYRDVQNPSRRSSAVSLTKRLWNLYDGARPFAGKISSRTGGQERPPSRNGSPPGKTGGTGAGGETRKGKGQPRAGQITSGHGGPK